MVALNTLFVQGFNSIVGSVGNLILEHDKEKSYSIYKKLFMLNAWVYGFFTASFYCIITPFIKVWVGEQYLLTQAALIAMLANFYLQGVRMTINIFKDAAGIFFEDRFMPIIEVIGNIVISIILVKLIGLPGVFIGTVLSSGFVVVYGNPKFVYTPLFGKGRGTFLLEHAKYALMAIIVTYVTSIIVNLIQVENMYMQVVVNIIICLIIPNIIYILTLHNTEEFKYFKSLIKNILNKKRLRKEN